MAATLRLPNDVEVALAAYCDRTGATKNGTVVAALRRFLDLATAEIEEPTLADALVPVSEEAKAVQAESPLARAARQVAADSRSHFTDPHFKPDPKK